MLSSYIIKSIINGSITTTVPPGVLSGWGGPMGALCPPPIPDACEDVEFVGDNPAGCALCKNI